MNAAGNLAVTSLTLAAKDGNAEMISVLAAAGVDVDTLEDTDSTALMYAAFFNDRTEVTELLIERGADLNLRDNIDETALHWATVQNHPDIAARLEAAGGE